MIKAPTKHGLDRKFKPWRKGKSQKANKRSSLKQQLRGHERLLAKLPESETERRKELQDKIKVLKIEIDQKQQSIAEKKNAEKSHGQRFLDRQRLTRLEKKVRNNNNNSTDDALLKIALDQVYVAHHPTDIKYMPLFQRGQTRVVDQSRQLYRRAVTRRRILKEIAKQKKSSSKSSMNSWMAADLYDLLPKTEWTIQDEERTFGGSITRSKIKEVKQQVKEDSRFQVAQQQHEAVLQVADKLEAELVKEEKEDDDDDDDGSSSSSSSTSTSGDKVDKEVERPTKQVAVHKETKSSAINRDSESSSSSDEDSDDDDDDDADPMKRDSEKFGKEDVKKSKKETVVKKEQMAADSSSSDSSSSDSDSDDDDDDAKANNKARTAQKPASEGDSSSSDSSSDSDSDSSSDDEDGGKSNKRKAAEPTQPPVVVNSNNNDDDDGDDDDDSDDDFLMDVDDDEDDKEVSNNVFEKTKSHVPALGEFRGDKSKGWETQRQRPGQFKKKRMRR